MKLLQSSAEFYVSVQFSREKVHGFHEIPKGVCDPRKVKYFKDYPKGKGRWLPQIMENTSGNVGFGPPTQTLSSLDLCAGSPLLSLTSLTLPLPTVLS